MNMSLNRAVVLALSILVFCGAGIAQDREDRDAVAAAAGNLYVVSAKAGGVNYLEGNVTVKRPDGTAGALTRGQFVDVGDVVSTGSNGRAEVLMNPGSFIRLDYNSAFKFESTALSTLRVTVTKGSAIFEVFASDDFKVTVEAAESRFYLTKSGVYRIDVDPSGIARLEVWKGKAQAGNSQATDIKKGRSALADGDSFAVAKFDKSKDQFEKWSESRAKVIAKNNRKLAAKSLDKSVLSSFRNYSWDCYNSVGLWVRNRRSGYYSFLPFGMGWRTPYGHRLGTNATVCSYPEYYWRAPRVPYRNRGGVKVQDNGGGNGTPAGRLHSTRFNPVPPFQRMQQSRSVKFSGPRSGGLGGGRRNGGAIGTGGGRSTGNSSSKPASSNPAKRSAPRPRRTDSKVKVN